jgi:hypothetical protein
MSTPASISTTVMVRVPMTFAIRGGRKQIVTPSGEAEATSGVSAIVPQRASHRTENAVLKALARAHRWQRMLENGDYVSITELARAEDINESYACRVLRLMLLAPSTVEKILNGQSDTDLLLKRLMKPFPVAWCDQLPNSEPAR